MRVRFASVACAVMLLAGCGWSSGEEVAQRPLTGPTTARRGTVVVDGCAPDPGQRATLERASTQQVVREVVLLCLVPRKDGTIGPTDASARAQLAADVASLRGTYVVHLGASFTDEAGQRFDGARTAAMIADAAFVSRFTRELAPFLAMVDGIELDVEQLPASSARDLAAFVGAVSSAVRPSRELALFVPPALGEPSDHADWSAFDLGLLAPMVDRVRVMTLDSQTARPGPRPIRGGRSTSCATRARAPAPRSTLHIRFMEPT